MIEMPLWRLLQNTVNVCQTRVSQTTLIGVYCHAITDSKVEYHCDKKKNPVQIQPWLLESHLYS